MEKILYKGKELFSPKLDIVFKALFGKEDSKELLRSFLNSVLTLNIQSIDDITLTNTEIPPDIAEGKSSRLDVCAIIKDAENDNHIDVEIQLADNDDMMKRSVYYVSKLFAGQLEKSETYDELGRAIGLSILDFNLFEDNKWMHRGRLKDIDDNKEFTDCFEVNFVEMKKLTHITETVDEKLQWLLFLNAKTEKELDMLVQQNAQIGSALDKLERISSDKKLAHQLIMREKAERDYNSGMVNAERRGMQKGIQQGVLKTAKSMKDGNMSIADIAKFTGLSEETIRSL